MLGDAERRSLPWYLRVGEGDTGYLRLPPEASDDHWSALTSPPIDLGDLTDPRLAWGRLAGMQRTPAWQALLDNQRLLAEPTYKALKAAVDVDPEKAPVLDTVSTVRLLVEASVALAGHGTPLGGLGPVARCEYDVNSAVTSMAEAETRAAAVGARGVYGPYVRAVRALVVSDVDHAAPERGYRLARILYAFAAADPSCPDGVLVSITALGQASAALLGRGYHAWLEDDWTLLESHLDPFRIDGIPRRCSGSVRCCRSLAPGVVRRSQVRSGARHSGADGSAGPSRGSSARTGRGLRAH